MSNIISVDFNTGEFKELSENELFYFVGKGLCGPFDCKDDLSKERSLKEDLAYIDRKFEEIIAKYNLI